MRINSITTTGVATAVWANATRTLTNPSGVFNDATRTLSSLGAGAINPVSQAATTLAASASLDLRPAAGSLRSLTFGVNTPGGGTTVIGNYDGTVQRIITTVAVGSNGGMFLVGNGTVGPFAKNNDGANPANYEYGGWDWVQ